MTRIDQALRRARLLEEGGTPAETPRGRESSSAARPEPASIPEPAHTPERQESARLRARHGVVASAFMRVVQARPAPRSTSDDAERLVTAEGTVESAADAFRSLAAALHESQLDRALNVLTVTSSVSGEGKTLVSANLALTLSRSYNRNVLLIDADLRCPGLHRFFGVPQDGGVGAALGAVSDGAAVPVHEVAERLALLPAGRSPRDPVAAISSDSMYQLVASAAAAFDWVILDAPPVGMIPDAGLISRLGDAVLLVVEAGRVRYNLVQRTVESIGADRIFGVVLNKVPESDLNRVYGHEYYAPYAEKTR